jgi:hypothetical protein
MNPKGVGGDSAAADERKVQQKYFILKDWENYYVTTMIIF